MSIVQCAVKWDGKPGLPGWSFFYLDTANAPNLTPINSFFDSIKSFFPLPMTWQVQGGYKVYDEATGKLTNEGAVTQPATITATGANAYAPQVGAQVKWTTPGFVNGRRVVGRTYLVPLVGAQIATDGKITATCANTINAAADAMRLQYNNGLIIWARPVYQKDADGHPTDVLLRPGTRHAVSSTTCPTKPVTLNRRRD